MNRDEMMTVTTVQFSRHLLQSRCVVKDAVIEECRHDVRGAIELQLRASVWAHFIERIDVKHPATWWDAVKIRFAPRWWLRRWPAKLTRQSFDVNEYVDRRSLPDGETFMSFAAVRQWPNTEDYVP